MRLEGKSVVVTGASSGMGKAIVELFVKEGARVVAVARRTQRLEELAASLAGAPGKIVPFTGDVSVEDVNNQAIEVAVSNFGRLDVLVNNAGVMDDMSPVGDVKTEDVGRIFSVNVNGPLFAMRRAVQVFLGQGTGGVIVNVASVAGFKTVAGAVYCASKAALLSLTRNTAFMYQPDGIRCNAIAPGSIDTEITASMGVRNMNGFGRVQKVLEAAPERGTTGHIASAALFLASDESSYVNGAVLVVDGGLSAG